MTEDQFGNVCRYLSSESEPCGMRLSIGLGGVEGVIQILTDKYTLRVCADEKVACKFCAHYRLLTEKLETDLANLAGKFGEY